VDAGPVADEDRFADLAFSALSRVGQLVEEESGEAVRKAAAALAEKLRPHCARAPGTNSKSS
jgi:hypothetical protein